MFEVESSTFDPYVLAVQSLATLQYLDFLYLFLHVSFYFFFFSWGSDMLCQFCCLTNCAYGLGILLVFYNFNWKKHNPTTLSCGAIYTQASIQTNSHLKCQLCYLAGFDIFPFLEVYQNFFRALQAAFIKSFYLVCVALDFTEISVPW